MTNKSHYPSLELCKKLTEIGFPTTFQHIWDSLWTVIWCLEVPEWMYVCPSVMEILDVMPQSVNWWVLSIHKDPDIWICMYDKPFEQAEISSWDTLSDAIAEMYIHLYENNYLPKK